MYKTIMHTLYTYFQTWRHEINIRHEKVETSML